MAGYPNGRAPAPTEEPPDSSSTKPVKKVANPLVRLLVHLTALAFVAGTLVAGAALYLHDRFVRDGPSMVETTVVVRAGTATAGIGALLEAAGIIEDGRLFTFGVRFFLNQRPLQAGEYAFPARVSARAAAEILQSGNTVVRRLTVPEGLTVQEVLNLVAGAEGLKGEVTNSVGEGTLLPETYHYAWGDDRDALVERMKGAMDAALKELWDTRASDLPFDTPEEAIILASIVERETGVASERARVAAVFVNRLRRGMRLQSDPTVVYGLTQGNGRLGRPLTRDDLTVEHPYNTYVIDGVPPGAIANPGRASIGAVLNPAETDELFFVADGSGGHAFARTLDEHNRNVARWRQLQRERARSGDEN